MSRPKESVWDYPRPPRLEHVERHLRVVFGGVVIAESRRPARVLETSHPPVYYVSPEDLVLAMFSEGLSTADALTAISGRGVGAGAARAAAVALGGRVVVHAKEGEGSSFEFRFPASALDGASAGAAESGTQGRARAA